MSDAFPFDSSPTRLPSLKPPYRLLVAISGGGTTLRNLLAAIDAGHLPAEVVHVISSRDDAGGLAYAEAAGIDASVLPRSRYESADDYAVDFFSLARESAADLVILAGFLAHVGIPTDFRHRVLNIHPSLIPAFAGKGYYGLRVHRAVLERGCRISGCTVHFVDDEYDHGPIVDQQAVPVHPDDTPETLAARVFEAECELFPAAIRSIAEGGLEVVERRVQPVVEATDHDSA